MPKHLRDFAAACRIPAELQILECTSTNLPVLLRYEDKNSMAHSVEARLPFLDYRLVEYAISLPIDLKIRDGWTKWPLRMAMQARMPSKIVWRKDKKGFEAPEREWLARHYATMFETVTSSALLARLSKPGALARAYRRLDPRSQWRLYSTALWERAFSVEP
jgi:asparagine synthase (glutamine-hydrolysing)